MIRIVSLLRRLRGDTRAIALSEFALASPLILTLGLVGVESTNLALVHMKVSQIAANLADTTSRIGQDSVLSLKQIRETDINDAFQAVRLQGGNYNITTHGRVILSSLETNASKGQWIHWQRCVGKLAVTSSYGVAGNGATGTGFAGMGPAGAEIKAPEGQAVMFVEIYYDYEPVMSFPLGDAGRFVQEAGFIIRDDRNLDPGLTGGSTRSNCNSS